MYFALSCCINLLLRIVFICTMICKVFASINADTCLSFNYHVGFQLYDISRVGCAVWQDTGYPGGGHRGANAVPLAEERVHCSGYAAVLERNVHEWNSNAPLPLALIWGQILFESVPHFLHALVSSTSFGCSDNSNVECHIAWRLHNWAAAMASSNLTPLAISYLVLFQVLDFLWLACRVGEQILLPLVPNSDDIIGVRSTFSHSHWWESGRFQRGFQVRARENSAFPHGYSKFGFQMEFCSHWTRVLLKTFFLNELAFIQNVNNVSSFLSAANRVIAPSKPVETSVKLYKYSGMWVLRIQLLVIHCTSLVHRAAWPFMCVCCSVIRNAFLAWGCLSFTSYGFLFFSSSVLFKPSRL